MNRKTPLPSAPKAKLWKYIAPISLGAAYAISKILSLRFLNPELALQENFNYLFLAGVLIAFALRPIAHLIYWETFTGITVITLMLFVLGFPGTLLDSFAQGIPLDLEFWELGASQMFASLFVAIIAKILLFPSKSLVTFPLLYHRFLRYLTRSRALVIFLSGGVYVLLFLVIQVSITPDMESLEPLQKLNEFFNLPHINFWQQIALLWIRGVLCTLVILPICILFSRSIFDLILILGSLMFVIASFAPAFVRFQQYASIMLIDEVIQGAFLYFLFASMMLFALSKCDKKSS